MECSRFLGLNRELDPVALATIAANLASNKYSREGDRQAIVRAAMLLSEAQRIVKNGPTIFDIPGERLAPLIDFWNNPANRELKKIADLSNPEKRFFARTKFITGQNRPDRAEEDLFEMLGEWGRRRGETDIGDYRKQFKELFSSSDINPGAVIRFRDCFALWKNGAKSAKAAQAGQRSRKKHTQ
jgi:hypothetical protein